MNRSAIKPPVTRVMDAAGQWIGERMQAVEGRLGELVGGHGELLREDAGATLSAGGKRLRPLLVLLCGGAGGGDRAVRGATAVELVHMATLVHDDVLDAAPLRRGRPTVVATSGRLRATATGDLLLSRAFAELTADRRQVELLSDASVALALGELAQRRDAWDVSLSAERYLERCRLKTAALFECACLIGRAPGEPELEERLRGFGLEIGLAFQLLDDVLDVTGPPERTGKARGTDLLDGTVTLPLILAREEDEGLAEVDLQALDPEAAEALCDRIAASGATERVRERGREHAEAAKRELARAGLADGERGLLELVADGVVERYA
jgi:geranylgeranyl pyrophosphate synthase